MPRTAASLVLLCLSLCLAGTGCSQVGRLEEVMQKGGNASQELERALGVKPALSVEISSKDGLEFILVNVRMNSAPQEMSAEDVRKKVNIIVRKHIPDATQVTVTF